MMCRIGINGFPKSITIPKIWINLFVLLSVLPSVKSQGVFIHPVQKDGKTEIEFLKIEPELDFDVHDESMFSSAQSVKFEFPLTEQDAKWLNTLFVIPTPNDTIRIRQEYRQMSDSDRKKFHDALNQLKKDKSVSLNKYDLLANIHSRPSSNSAAHGGPAFLGWHRVFLIMMENALRQVEPTVTIPYWDCTIDAAMDNPAKSVIWSKYFFGNGLGKVIDGPFANWTTPTRFGFGPLRRATSGQRKLITSDDIERVMQQKHIGNISYPDAKASQNLEQLHNNVHVWVGGLMKNIEIGAFDPVFYLLHSFVDKIWDIFRLKQRNKQVDLEMDYPKFYGRPSHAPMAPMGLGRLTAIDGLSSVWSMKVLYSVSDRKCKNTSNPCDSKYLKCLGIKGTCIPKTTEEFEREGTMLNLRDTSIGNGDRTNI